MQFVLISFAQSFFNPGRGAFTAGSNWGYSVSFLAFYESMSAIFNRENIGHDLLRTVIIYVQFHVYSRQSVKQVLSGACSIGGNG